MLYLIFFFLSIYLKFTSCKPNPVLLVSFDGFRADKQDAFLKNNPNSNFAKFIERGVKAEYYYYLLLLYVLILVQVRIRLFILRLLDFFFKYGWSRSFN